MQIGNHSLQNKRPYSWGIFQCLINVSFQIIISKPVTFYISRAHHRAKDVLYLMARLFHMLGVYQDRNQVSAELKRLEDQYTTNEASQLAIML